MSYRNINRISKIWNYFEDDNNGGAVCLVCNITLKKHKSASTTNFRKHLVAKHPAEANALYNGEFPRSLKTLRKSMPELELYHPSKSNFSNTLKVVKKKRLQNIQDHDVSNTESERDHAEIEIEIVPGYSLESSSSNETKTSPIWKFFKAISINEAKCTLCDCSLRYYGGHVANLKTHIQIKHPSIGTPNSKYEDTNACRPISFSSSTSTKSNLAVVKQQFSASMQKKMLLDEKVTAMIAIDLQPISIVEQKGFMELMNAADPHYSLPTRDSLTTELLPQLYKQKVALVVNKLEEIDHIALTTDLWSPKKNETYLSITAHFISPTEWSLQSVMLASTSFYGTPNGRDISCKLQRLVTEWNVSEKITVMVTDNETNALLANEQLPWAYVPCLGHLIHLVVTDALAADAEATALIEKVYEIVSFFHHSHLATESLSAMLISLNMPSPERKLVINVATRWNSIFYMLKLMYEFMDAVNAILEVNEMGLKCLSEQDGEIMKKILSSLKPFEIATTTMSSDKSNSISMAMPLVKGLVKMMTTVTEAKEPLTEKLKEGLIVSFGKMEEIEWIVAATLLDPRFKKFPFAEEEAIEKAKESIISDVTSITGGSIDLRFHDVSSTVASTSSPKTGEDSFWEYLDVMTNAHESKDVSSAASREVQCYIDSPPIPRDENPMLYWKQHQEMLPNLYKVALKYMAVPITSVQPDRLFTKEGDALIERKSMLEANTVDMILFLNTNFYVD